MKQKCDNNYLRQVLELIHISVKRCGWNVGWGVPYGSFIISVTKELLDVVEIEFEDESDIIFAAHHIASRMEEKLNG